MKNVSHDVFYNFIDNYPRKLEIDVSFISEPPTKTWNDFTLGVWPESIIASCRIFDDIPYYTETEKNYVNKDKWLENGWTITNTNKE